ncbi:MAG: integrase core domain-containing protein [Leptospirales bacterium]
MEKLEFYFILLYILILLYVCFDLYNKIDFRSEMLIQKFNERFRIYWAKISSKTIKSPGRPPVSDETKAIIKKMLLENFLIGGLRIYMNLIQLGIHDASLSSVYRIIRNFKINLHPEKSQTWKTFLYNSRVVAMDFLTVQVEMAKERFRPLYIYIIMDHERRKVIHYNCTFEPNEDWVVQQLKHCFGDEHNYKYMVHDRDSAFMHRVKEALPVYFDIESKPTAPQSPWQNPFVESFNGTLRRELLNHVIVKDEFHLRKLLNEYIEFYNNHRMHSGLMDSPEGGTIQKRPQGAKLKSRSVLNGLHHIYYWSGNEPDRINRTA